MTAHIVLDAVDPDRPATLSAGVLTGLLREELGFDGIIVTDLMGMQAIAAGWTVREAAVLAFKAGADIVMAAGTTEVQVETLDTLLHAVEGGEISEERLDASVRRILRAKWRVGVLADPFVDLATVAGVGSADHQRAAVELMAGGPVLVKNDGILPFDAGSAEATLVACMTHPSTSGRTPVTHVRTIAPMVRDICGGSVMWWKAKSDAPTDDEMTEVRLLAERLDRVIVFTYTDGPPRPEQARLVQALVETGKPVVAISLGTPYDIAGYPEAPAYLASFALGFVPHHLVAPEAIRAALRIVFGAQPSGTLPVEIPGLYARGHGLRYG